MMLMWRRFWRLVARDLRLARRQGGAMTMAVMFFVITVALFPLGVGPGGETLSRISTGVIWVAALLAALLPLDRLFQADFEDGSLELLMLGPLPLELVALAKCLAQWIGSAIPLIAVSPVLALLMQMDMGGLPVLVATMVIGTPALTLIGAVGAALTVGLRRGGVLLTLLVLPLYIPVLIFAVGAVDAALWGTAVLPHIYLLSAGTLGALALAPWATAAALRLSAE